MVELNLFFRFFRFFRLIIFDNCFKVKLLSLRHCLTFLYDIVSHDDLI